MSEKRDPNTIHFERHIGADYKQRKGKYAREVWETSKAHDFGFCKWAVHYWHEEMGAWVQVAGSIGYMTKDVALSQSEFAMNQMIEHDAGQTCADIVLSGDDD